MASKIMMYRAMRLCGLRLYASKNWAHATGVNSCMCKRLISMKSVDEGDDDVNVGVFESIKNQFGLKGNLRYFPTQLQRSAFYLYLSAGEAPRYNKIYDYIELPDNMFSWYRLTSIHVWLFMVRLASEGRDGRLAAKILVEVFNVDMQAKAKAIGKEMKVAIKEEHLRTMYQGFLTSLYHYDEGLLGSDKHLAGAVWRCLFANEEEVDPRHLEIIVEYIRKQVTFLQVIDSAALLNDGFVPFLPVVGTSVPKSTIDTLRQLHDAKMVIKTFTYKG